MSNASKLPMHGRNHRPGGSDPIPGSLIVTNGDDVTVTPTETLLLSDGLVLTDEGDRVAMVIGGIEWEDV